ncbi:MAG: Dabb family protein [wastewater metagenome]|nr:Dabb family protein [Candidatus Loosdrechtia aerotolerans]
MIKHIVVWRLKDFAKGTNKIGNAEKIKELLESLRRKIVEIQHIEVGINITGTDASSDVVLYSEFNRIEDLNAYQKHPEHMKVVQFIMEVCTERRVVDYEI